MSSSAGGWRGRRRASYATEAALAALKYGFDSMGLPEIVAVTMARNLRSRAVMRRIGMTSDPAEDFDDPDVDEGPLRRLVVYRRLRDLKLTDVAVLGPRWFCPPIHDPGHQTPIPALPQPGVAPLKASHGSPPRPDHARQLPGT